MPGLKPGQPRRERIDWKSERDRIDLADVAIDLLGPPPGRQGERSRRLWWSCPFHADANPSFSIDPGKLWYRCYGCDSRGDAATLVMGVLGCNFPEAVAYLTRGIAPRHGSGSRALAPRGPIANSQASSEPEGMSIESASTLIAAASERLWSGDDKGTLAYLTGPARCLTPETIRAAGLGFVDPVNATTRDGRPYEARGIVVPWRSAGGPTLVKVRQPSGLRPRYAEVFRHRSRNLGIYPGPEAVRSGRPLIVVEGEFDALCLAQEIGELASVITLGSASARPEPSILGRLLCASPWFIATDADEAGDRAAAHWPASARRVRPPGEFKDWTEVKAGRVDLLRWWRDVFAGDPKPRLFTWEELASWRWGPAAAASEAGVIRE